MNYLFILCLLSTRVDQAKINCIKINMQARVSLPVSAVQCINMAQPMWLSGCTLQIFTGVYGVSIGFSLLHIDITGKTYGHSVNPRKHL